jgi:hypothetical protein
MTLERVFFSAMPVSNPSPLWGGSAERSGGRGGDSHNGSLARGYPHPTSLRLATLPTTIEQELDRWGRDKKEQLMSRRTIP